MNLDLSKFRFQLLERLYQRFSQVQSNRQSKHLVGGVRVTKRYADQRQRSPRNNTDHTRRRMAKASRRINRHA